MWSGRGRFGDDSERADFAEGNRLLVETVMVGLEGEASESEPEFNPELLVRLCVEVKLWIRTEFVGGAAVEEGIVGRMLREDPLIWLPELL